MKHDLVPGFIALVLIVAAIAFIGMMSGCVTHTQVIDHPHVVSVPVPVVVPIDAALLADCQPEPLGSTTVGAALVRLSQTEDCLAKLRAQLAAIRSAPH